MATLQRLSVHDSSIFCKRAARIPLLNTRAANHHYWASRSGRSYGRSIIYKKNTLYPRWSAQRTSLYIRPWGSWSRRTRESSAGEDINRGRDRSRSGIKEDLPKNCSKEEQQPWFRNDTFFDLLRHDAAAAYKYLQKEMEKDPYKWTFDPRDTGSAWNPAEWWDKQKHFFDRRRAWSEKFPSRKISDDQIVTEKREPSVADSEEYTIDLISLRKVPVVKTKTGGINQEDLYPQYQGKTTGNAYSIPVKRYSEDEVNHVKSSQRPILNKSPKDVKLAGFANQSWLVKEGFTISKDEAPKKDLPGKDPVESKTSTQILPDLDRVSEAEAKSKRPLDYPPKEITTDDVDLLRASDIRAASGHVKDKTTPSQTEIKQRSEALEYDWNKAEKAWSQDLTVAYKEMLEKRKARLAQMEANATKEEEGKSAALSEFRKVKQHHDELRSEIQETIALLKQSRNDALQDFLSQETNSVKHNFEKFEQRSRKHIAGSNDGKDTTAITGNSNVTQEHVIDQQKKLEKLERDAELVRQIQAIYEEKYGKITVEHKQVDSPGESSINRHQDTLKVAEPVTTNSPPQDFFAQPRSPVKTISADRPGSQGDSMSLREILYQNIENLNISKESQKRFKFALRGLPELDSVIPVSSLKPIPTSKKLLQERIPSPEPIPVAKTNSPHSSRPSKPPVTPKEQQKPSSSDKKHVVPKLPHHGRHQHVDHAPPKKAEENTYVYKILALDNASNEIAVATTTSSIKHKSSVPRSAAGLLVHLDQPAKYFSFMESLDAEGFQLVSGSRTMLVYRRRVNPDGTPVERTIEKPKDNQRSRSMQPLREEPVFSGHLKPKERLVRSSALANRRAQHRAKATTSPEHREQQKTSKASSQDSEAASTDAQQPAKRKTSSGLTRNVAIVVLAVTVCYTIGLIRNINAQKEYEEGLRLRREEAAIRKSEAQRKEWSWF